MSDRPVPGTFRRYLAYSASAGSGKTFALAVRYVALLFLGESPASILAATFTNKAAAEMRHRVIEALRRIGDASYRDFAAQVCQQTALSRAELLQRQPRVLQRFLGSPNRIVTLDSFFASILRASSLEIGLEPTFATQETDTEAIEEYFLEGVYHHGHMQDLARLALEIEDKRFMRILGLMDYFYTVDPLLPPHTAPASDGIRAAEAQCEEARRALEEALERAGAAPRALKLLRADSPHTLITKSLFEKAALSEHSWFKQGANAETEAHYARLKEALRLWARQREARVLDHLFDAYGHYRNGRIRQAKSTGVLGFDDLTYFTWRLMQEIPDHAFLYFKLDARFRHILLDEFQDTSTLQFLLLRPLIDELFDGSGDNTFRSFFYVGDTKQSLYRFRGGVEALFGRVHGSYDGMECEPMETNYRSSRHVVEQVNRWFADIMPDYVPQKARKDAVEGYVDVVEIAKDETLIDRAIAAARAVHQAGVDWDAMAFLVHTNKDGMTLQEACAALQIPTRLKTSSSLRTHPRIAAMVAMVNYLYRGVPIDAEAMLSFVGTNLSETVLEGYTAWMSPLQVLDRLMRDFGYFDDDPNRLKLLEFAAGFADMATFIDAFAVSDLAVADRTTHGIAIMTIHGSKGLEFDHVFVLDRLTRPRSDAAPLLFQYRNHLHIGRIVYRTKGREHVDPDYAAILEEQKSASNKDRLNLLYVALTRAAVGLTVVRKPKESVFDLIGLETLRLGAPAVHPTIRKRGSGAAIGSPPPETRSVVLSNYGYQEKPAREEEDGQEYDAMLFGTAMHYGLEMLADFTSAAVPDAVQAVRNRYGHLLSAEDMDAVGDRIARLVETEDFHALLEGARIRKEQSLVFEGAFLQIDLLLEYSDHLRVIDYKSSRKYADHHRRQVAHYVRAVEAIFGQPVEGAVVYILEKKIEILTIT